jgi:ribosome-associated toxin RatA of RatAB toxin-antitoxin module
MIRPISRFEHLLALLVTFLIPVVAPLASSADDTYDHRAKIRIKKEGDNRFVQGEIRIDAPQEEVWKVLTDYNNLANFIPNMQKSRLQSSDADGPLKLEQVSIWRFLVFKKRIRVLLRVFEHFPDRIAFSQIDGDFHTYSGAWDIDRVDDAIRLRITLRVRPAFFAPGFFLDRMAKGTAEQALEVIRSETLRRLQED